MLKKIKIILRIQNLIVLQHVLEPLNGYLMLAQNLFKTLKYSDRGILEPKIQ